ncbi:MAG: thymidylate synthase, partial [Candidatus Dadabacteria bacterium]|nr:thymidylate synthase [Candidatus Dadabacteria bacterium]
DTNIKYLVDNDVNIWNGDAYREYDTNKTVKGTGKRMTEEEFVHNIKHNDEFAKVAGDLG